MRSTWLAGIVLLVAACGPRNGSTGAGTTEAQKDDGKALSMTHDPPAAGGCAGASLALRTALAHPIDSYALPQGAGHAALAKAGATADQLVAIGRDSSCPNPIRFAAFEGWIGVVGENALGKLDDPTAAEMAKVQAVAIRSAEEGGLWSLPPDVTASHVARHLIVLGRRVVPQLRPLLDDTRELPYLGSETASIASLRKYRVSDLAAAIIATIVGVPYQDAATPAARDTQIAALRT
jgi:hypothetical protein